MDTENHQGFWTKVWEELQPILRHTLVVGVILLVFCIIAGVFKLIHKLLPEQSEHLKWLEMMDVVLIYVLVLLFGLYAIAEVLIRSIKGIQVLWKEVFWRKEALESKRVLESATEKAINEHDSAAVISVAKVEVSSD